MLFGWFQTLEDFTKKQGRYLKDGLERSIVNHHSIAQEDGDRKFAASIIPRDRVLDLIPPIESGKYLIREPLVILLRSPAAGTGATGPNEDVCKRSLLVCLDAIHHIAKAPIIPDFRVHLRINC
ncbi:hypothetical protein BGY98DRAFT_1103936 [Russula aff. rugulosa BPL654]|nr:hypothetical protein BGY98DRAFT_1103936 [Russula aff. rugulosa BPL654]